MYYKQFDTLSNKIVQMKTNIYQTSWTIER